MDAAAALPPKVQQVDIELPDLQYSKPRSSEHAQPLKTLVSGFTAEELDELDRALEVLRANRRATNKSPGQPTIVSTTDAPGTAGRGPQRHRLVQEDADSSCAPSNNLRAWENLGFGDRVKAVNAWLDANTTAASKFSPTVPAHAAAVPPAPSVSSASVVQPFLEAQLSADAVDQPAAPQQAPDEPVLLAFGSPLAAPPEFSICEPDEQPASGTALSSATASEMGVIKGARSILDVEVPVTSSSLDPCSSLTSVERPERVGSTGPGKAAALDLDSSKLRQVQQEDEHLQRLLAEALEPDASGEQKPAPGVGDARIGDAQSSSAQGQTTFTGPATANGSDCSSVLVAATSVDTALPEAHAEIQRSDLSAPAAKPLVRSTASTSQLPDVQLDMNKVRALSNENLELARLFADAFEASDDDSPDLTIVAPSNLSTPTDGSVVTVEVGACSHRTLTSLDQPHQSFLQQLLSRLNWQMSEAEELARQFDLMLDGAIEFINEAAFDEFNEPLIEHDGANLELAPHVSSRLRIEASC